jgi:hypothetical protein
MKAMNMALGGAALGGEPYGHNQWYYDCTRFSNNRTATMHQTTNSSTAFKNDGHQEHRPQKQQQAVHLAASRPTAFDAAMASGDRQAM